MRITPALILAGGLGLAGATGCSAAGFSTLNVDFLGRGGGSLGLAGRTGDIDNVFWNASGLGCDLPASAFGSYLDYLVGLRGGTVGYVGAGREGLGYGFYLSYLSSGTITRTGWDDPIGGRGETFEYAELVAGLSGGMRLTSRLRAGVTLNLAQQSLDQKSAGGVFGDISTTIRVYPVHDDSSMQVHLAVVTRNVRIATGGDDLGDTPRDSELAVALEPSGGLWAMGASCYFGRQNRRELRAGLCARLSAEFEVRIGYRRRVGAMSDAANQLPWERGINFGFGISFGNLWVDYSFEDASPLDNIHRFGVRVNLSR